MIEKNKTSKSNIDQSMDKRENEKEKKEKRSILYTLE
jgi:hypothetical protein